MLAQVNREFYLGESLRETVARPWWDILSFRLAMFLQDRHSQYLESQAERSAPLGRPGR